MDATTTYRLISTKGTRIVTGTLETAQRAAIAMDRNLQPSFGVTIECGRTRKTVCEIRNGQVIDD